jgi:ribonuclease P protein component
MLPRKYKLKKDNDFKKVFQQGKYYQKDFIKLRVLKNNLAIPRFGFIIGLKVSKKATQRNKIKRQLEEVIRLHLNQISAKGESVKGGPVSGEPSSFDIVILVNSEIIEKSYQEIEKNLINLLKKAKLLNPTS